LSLLRTLLWCASAPPDLYSLSLHDALPISNGHVPLPLGIVFGQAALQFFVDLRDHVEQGFFKIVKSVPHLVDHRRPALAQLVRRSEEHTSELQSRENLVCRLLLEKKKPTRK